MKRTTVLSILLLMGIVFSYPAIGADPVHNCGRLKTGDNFNRINEILDCIEAKINVHSPMKLENTTIYDEEKEPNESFGEANLINLGSIIKAQIENDKAYDVFTFIAPDPQKKLRLILRQTYMQGFYPRVTVYAHDKDKTAEERGSDNKTIYLQLKPKPKEQYYVSVTCWNGCHKNMFYELEIKEE